jgi:hypothetical protein
VAFAGRREMMRQQQDGQREEQGATSGSPAGALQPAERESALGVPAGAPPSAGWRGGDGPGPRGGVGAVTAPEHVPSEQLWRAAIMAALQAAATAAELRRAFGARRAAAHSDGPRAVA